MVRVQAHHSPLQAPPLEYQCSSGGNSSRTAIRKKKKTQQHLAAGRKAATADLCGTTATTKSICVYSHKYIGSLGIYCSDAMFVCSRSYISGAVKMHPQLLKAHRCLWVYCSKMCAAPSRRQGHTSQLLC